MRPVTRAVLQVRAVDRWAHSSQQQARRNAMVASTRLTQCRVEREEVDDYVREIHARREAVHRPLSVAVAR